MRSRLWLCVPFLLLGVSFATTREPRLNAQAPEPVALTGVVTSAEEGAMEGVLVSLKKAGSPITVTIVSDPQGRYRFPQSRLEQGAYTLRIRATGYDLPDALTVDVVRGKTTTTDLTLQKTRDLASQLSNAEWLASAPGTDAQKASIRPCTHCHTLERVLRTRYNADQWLPVIERMATYPQL